MPSSRTAVLDLTSCDREPIHIPGSIQPHGFLIALDARSHEVSQVSVNFCEFRGCASDEVLGSALAELIGTEAYSRIVVALDQLTPDTTPVYLAKVEIAGAESAPAFSITAHQTKGTIVLELEPDAGADETSFPSLYPLVGTFLSKLQQLETIRECAQFTAEEVRRLTGFDRVLIYQFDDDWNGLVIAEDRNERLPAYLDLRFPASDIPRQARQLYRVNRWRLIVDADYTPVPLVPAVDPRTGDPLDLTMSVLRSVSPIHVEYMKNMGTWSSMSISILKSGDLWGLIACHSQRPRNVSLEVRAACDYIGQSLSLYLATRETKLEAETRIALKSVEARLLMHMAEQDSFVEGLASHPDELLELTAASGAAILDGDRCLLVGTCPAEAEIRKIGEWLDRERRDVFATESLASVFPDAAAYSEVASGLLSISVSKLHRSYVLWFRPEVISTVKWGGDPTKPVREGQEQLHPRHSFDMWKETVRLRSRTWSRVEIDMASDLRNGIVGIVLKKAEELADLNEELRRSNRELEAFSYSVSHDLRAPFRHILGYSELLQEESKGMSDKARRYIATIIESANYAGTLVDNLLSLSRVARTKLNYVPIDMNLLVEEVRQDALAEARGRNIIWRVADLPVVSADLVTLRLALHNLLSNALKFTRCRTDAIIEIGCEIGRDADVFFVRDNGIGFDMAYVDKLFGVFQRLHRMEDFEGTGIGLANVRRIIERHRGRTWAEGEEQKGATFYFSLPKTQSWRDEDAQAYSSG